MSVPEPRFEVPPEYAEVYERAYRRAYEEVQTSLGGVPGDDEELVLDAEGRPVLIPRQRSLRRPPIGTGHRADRGSARGYLVGFVTLLSLVLLGAFVTGRLTADGSPVHGTARGAATQGIEVPAKVRDVTTTCTALSAGNDARSNTEFDVTNVLDTRPSTAWACDGLAVGQVLTFTLAPGTRLARVGIVPGYARGSTSGSGDLYAQGNRITRVSWLLGNGTSIHQSLTSDPDDRSLRTVDIAQVPTTVLRLKILKIDPGTRNRTAISTVQILAVR